MLLADSIYSLSETPGGDLLSGEEGHGQGESRSSAKVWTAPASDRRGRFRRASSYEKGRHDSMNPVRVAGLLYLLLAITGAFGILYVPGTLIVLGNAEATADRIRTSESLFRLAIASELISATTFIFVVLALYRLFKGVNQEHASLMVILVLVSVPISFLNVLSEIAALMLVSGADFLSVYGKPQLDALALVFLRLHSQGFVVVGIFWGLWLFPLAMLAFRSGFVPRVVGGLLILAGMAYVVVSLTSLLLPQYASLVSSVAVLAEAGELSMIVWLLTTRTRATSFPRAAIAAPSSARGAASKPEPSGQD
ncbi:MAG: DUF4386 domain-containing protein [Chloroflexota bacterium]|nr:DUF4386 domain-containing protein [Chloroflexota bacterium]